MSTSLTSESISETSFICDCPAWMRTCTGEPFYGKHEGKRYCILHFPGKKESTVFKAVLERKIENNDFDFRGIWFTDEVEFRNFEFKLPADFRYATFSAGAVFEGAQFNATTNFMAATFMSTANFLGARFERAYFRQAIFRSAADFKRTRFSAEADFSGVRFGAGADFLFAHFNAGVEFSSADFSEAAVFSHVRFSAAAVFEHVRFDTAIFQQADFSGTADFSDARFTTVADFRYTIFADRVRFAGSEVHHVFSATSALNLQFARIEKPEHMVFHTALLLPSWFVNVDARKFEFTNVDWHVQGINRETESLQFKQVSAPHRMLAIACRQIAVNAEENHRYEEASRFRYMAMDARRLEHWNGFDFRRLSWWYWLASGYGERVLRALMVLIGLWLLAAALYTQVGFARWEPRITSESEVAIVKRDEVGEPLKLARALTYSAAVMTFQRPEPRPATTAAQGTVLLETILGPVQAALLALAIRRKFMR